MARPRTETVLLAAALLAVVLFVGSFVLGLVSDDASATAGAVPTDSAAASPSGTGGLAAPRGRIEVLNAAGQEGAARRATERLRSGGFDVVFYGNASSRVERSVVLSRVEGAEDVARAAATRLGIPTVETRPDSTLLLDATVLVGPDWPPPEVAAPETGWRARLRAWFR